jgi:LemA protein
MLDTERLNWLLVSLLMVFGLVAVLTYNRLVRSRNRVREAWSSIDVQLKRRADLIPNLVESVRGYASHERNVFEGVARARVALQRAGHAGEATTANQALTANLTRLLAVAERYPALRASAGFIRLQEDLSDAEDKIAYARHFYNRNVLDYNTRVQAVPTVFLARLFGFEPAEFFDAQADDRRPVSVDFTSMSAPTSGEPSP